MPTWKIEKYQFYFRVGEPLKKHEPAHIHVRGTQRGKIQFWLEKPNEKIKDEISIKKIQGRISEKEQNEIEKLVIKNKDLFLKEWNKRKTKAGNNC